MKVRTYIVNWDVRTAQQIQRWAGGALLFWDFFARYGLYGFLVAIFAFAEPILPSLTALVAAWLLQLFFRRERPTVTRTAFRQWMLYYSFPSVHAAIAFACAVATSIVVVEVMPQFAWMFIPSAFILALGIALSRVVVGVHHPTDVLAGALLGSTISLVFATL